METIRKYYHLTKPGIIYGNSISTIAGYLFASTQGFDIFRFIATIVGFSFVLASSCVLNNLIDADLDSKMSRTKRRALPTGSISVHNAVIFALALGILGFLVLYSYTTPIAVISAMACLFLYVAIYTPAKRLTIHSTLIGTLSGAMPPVVGYTAVSNAFDANAIVLFLILTAWQMPHFFAIGIFQSDDYKKAGMPIWPTVKGIASTRRHTILYVALFIIACIALQLFGSATIVFTLVMTLVGLYWLKLVIRPAEKNINKWAKNQFRFSLLVLLIFGFTAGLDGLLFQNLLG